MTYKVYKNKYHAYLEDCVQPYMSIYNTRHSEPTRHMLTIPIMTIKGTNPLNIYLIVISIQPHDCGTRFLGLVDVLLR